MDAQLHFDGNAKIAWNVYAGPSFVHDVPVPSSFGREPLDVARVAELLADGAVIAWVRGRAEIGPRALGNRSLLAAPFQVASRDRLNKIKAREGYRPIAPVCREEDVSSYFDWTGPSPYMLYFHKVLDARLQAVTHADGTARAQTVRADQNPRLHALLSAFAARTGVGVLCNTSLNFPGRGFINRTSDLVEYVRERDLDGFVLDDELHLHLHNAANGA